jgi:uncharacterized protein (DUF849 family)
VLKACLNGARTAGEHPRLPVTVAALASDAVRVGEAGAQALHVHAKDEAGRDTLVAASVDETVLAVRTAAPNLPCGVTTGAWAEPDVARRLRAISTWSVLPDFASVNWHEDGAEAVARSLLDRGIGVEAGLWTLDAVRAWLTSPLREECLRVLLELPDGLDHDATVRLADTFLATLGGAVARGRILLHGEGSSTWPALRYAFRLGCDTRIGLEDTLVLPGGGLAPDNAALVVAAHQQAGRQR